MKEKMSVFATILVLIFIIFIYSSLANLGALYIYHKFNLNFGDFTRGFIATTVTFFLFTLTFWIITLVKGPRRMAFLASIIDAMKRISKGDYNVRVGY